MDLNAVDVYRHEQISEQGLYPAFLVEKKTWLRVLLHGKMNRPTSCTMQADKTEQQDNLILCARVILMQDFVRLACVPLIEFKNKLIFIKKTNWFRLSVSSIHVASYILAYEQAFKTRAERKQEERVSAGPPRSSELRSLLD